MEGQIYSVNSLHIIWLIITCLPQLVLLSNAFATVPPAMHTKTVPPMAFDSVEKELLVFKSGSGKINIQVTGNSYMHFPYNQ